MSRRGVRFAPKQSDEDVRLQLEELRESTKAALLESWQEVELLQVEKQEYQERTSFLHSELESAKEREAELRGVIAKLEKLKTTNAAPRSVPFSKLFVRSKNESNGTAVEDSKSVNSSTGPSVSSSSTKSGSSSAESSKIRRRSEDPSLMRRAMSEKIDFDPTSSNNSKTWWNNGNRAGSPKQLQEERERMEHELLMQMTELEREKNKLISEWQVRVKCRDSAIQSMEKSQQIQGQTVNFLRQELDGVKSQNANKEKRLVQEIERLRAKLNDRKEIIQKQASRLEKCQQYIAELTEELEQVARATPSRDSIKKEQEQPLIVAGNGAEWEQEQQEATPTGIASTRTARVPPACMPPIEVSFSRQNEKTPAA